MNAAAAVLVADDDAMNRLLLRRLLERDGHAVTTASDGAEALELLASHAFDVVLLDILMPHMDGVAVLEHLKADQALRHVPVIMISAVEEMDSVVRCIELGADDYLAKPFDPAVLRARINAGLARKRFEDLQREYLQQVEHVVGAATALEAGSFSPDPLDPVAERGDALGVLARVFQRMAVQVVDRERSLRAEVTKLRIEIDEVRAMKQVEEITETDYFQKLQQRAAQLRLGAAGEP